MKTKFSIITALLLACTVLYSFGQAKPWAVPDKNAKMANPVKSSDESIKTGKAVWSKHCQSCHGKLGKGDGTKAATLETEVGDLTLEDSQKQSDGSMFFKVAEGRDEMPSFKKKIPDEEEIWSVINYVRTLKGK